MLEKNYKNLSDTQNLISNKIKGLIVDKHNKKKYIALPSAPGSGKTSTLLSGLENLYSEIAVKEDCNFKQNGDDVYLMKGYTSHDIKEEVDLKYLHNPTQEKKVLILAFNKNAVDEFIKKADKINIKTIVQSDDNEKYFIEKDTKLSLLIEVSTYHSLLLKVAKPIIEKLGYIPDYSKANFYKKDINFICDKYNVDLNKNDVALFFEMIKDYHNSPLDFVSFVKKWNIEKENLITFDNAKKLKGIIDAIYSEMSKGNITMPHCFYYKTVHKMAIQNPNFLKNIFKDQQGKEYNLILVDEAQDSDEIIYDLIKMSQKKAIFVGDRYQNIYGFRGTYNVFDDLMSNEINDTVFFKLQESFRYGKSISSLTSAIPNILNHSYSTKDILTTIGMQSEDYIHTQSLNIKNIKKMAKNIITSNINANKKKKESMNQVAIICRSNKRAFEIYSDFKNDPFLADNVKIESGLKSKTKDFVSKGINAIEDETLKEQIKSILKEDEIDFEMMISNNDICLLLENTEYSFLLKCKDESLKNAMLQKSSGYETVTIITVHGSKGLEYEKVIVADDFIKNDDLNFEYVSFNEDMSLNQNEIIKDEEINIIYTAATRAKESLFFMDSPLYQKIKTQVLESSKFNSKNISKNIDFLLNADVIPIKKEENIIKNENIMFENKNLFYL